MFSTDEKVNLTADLIKKLRQYAELKAEYLKYSSVEKLTHILTVLIVFLILFLFTATVLFFLSLALEACLEPVVGKAFSYCIVAGVYLLLFGCIYLMRNGLIKKPILRILSKIILKDND